MDLEHIKLGFMPEFRASPYLYLYSQRVLLSQYEFDIPLFTNTPWVSLIQSQCAYMKGNVSSTSFFHALMPPLISLMNRCPFLS